MFLPLDLSMFLIKSRSVSESGSVDEISDVRFINFMLGATFNVLWLSTVLVFVTILLVMPRDGEIVI